MGTVNTDFFKRVKYILSSDNQNELEIVQPIGWDSPSKEYSRNPTYHGIFTTFSNKLKFIENGKDFINFENDIFGINSKIKLTRFEKHPKTDKWVRDSWGYLDLSTWEEAKNYVAVKFNSGGLEQLIKSRESESVEIDRTTSIDGINISALNTEEVLLEGKRIFLKSKWKCELVNETEVDISVFSEDGNTRTQTRAFPLNLISQSHEEAQSTISISEGNENNGTNGIMMLANFDRTRQIHIYGNQIQFKTDITRSEYDWAKFQVNLVVFENGIDYDLKERRILFHAGENSTTIPSFMSINGQSFSINIDEIIDVEDGDSVALELFLKADLINGLDGKRVTVKVSNFNGDLYCEEDSYFEQTKSKFILFYDLLERLSAICGNKENIFYSEFFGRIEKGYSTNNPFSFVGVTHGFWLRGFEKDLTNDENRFKPLTTSFKEALETSEACFNTGMGIEEINGFERIRVEDLSFFYNRNTTVKLPNQIKNQKRRYDTKYFPSSIEIGYDKAGNYTEAQGLDESNGKSTFTTIINRIKEVYSKISSYRGDSSAKEFARRKPFYKYPDTDTSYDTDVFLLDTKKSNTALYLERKWQDDFEQQPSGIFSPNTGNNYRLSPINMLLRHAWVISSGLIKYPLDYIRYSSSTVNSQLKTKLIGGQEYAENGNILNSELQKARFTGQIIEFEHECDFDVLQQINGTTTILGKKINNVYGVFEFVNENGKIEKGFLIKLNPEGKGKFELLLLN